ncbi:MAG TPA: hypothetical protein VJ486_08900 [Geothrix sp.]|nr:hypothetical protein [Geothrix sp.]
MRLRALIGTLLLGTCAAWGLYSQVEPDGSGHAALASAAACAGCHAAEAQPLWEAHPHTPCTQACLTCHGKDDMARHHPVGHPVTKPPRMALRLTRDGKSACFTCHDLSNRRYDAVRWKAESLFSRIFHRETRHKTYYLATRNDRGQLCLACH